MFCFGLGILRMTISDGDFFFAGFEMVVTDGASGTE